LPPRSEQTAFALQRQSYTLQIRSMRKDDESRFPLCFVMLPASVYGMRYMWEVNNSTPYKADRGWVRDISGREVWLVAVRARFRIVPEHGAVWDPELRQSDVKLAPEFSGEGALSRLTADSDLVHEKRATDVLMSGHACAPRRHLARQLLVSMSVGPLSKRVAVFGDRLWTLGGASEPQPFSRMPLDYGRAYGGPDLAGDLDAPSDWYEQNPAGLGYTSRARVLDGAKLPNLEDPNSPLRSPMDRPRPMSFGPIAAHWPQRRHYAGTYDAAWKQERLPLLPLDFDPRFYQQAPEDQQVEGFLRGGEMVRLEGVHPDGPLEFKLPRISLAFETEFDDLTKNKHRANLHTVVFEPDIPAVSMVWHTSLECHTRVNWLLKTRIWERVQVKAVSRMA